MELASTSAVISRTIYSLTCLMKRAEGAAVTGLYPVIENAEHVRFASGEPESACRQPDRAHAVLGRVLVRTPDAARLAEPADR